MNIKRLFASAIFVLGIASGVSAQQMPPIPVDDHVRIGHLDNGLTYYIRHNEEPAGQVNFYIAQKVGSILEDESQRGLAHFLEHMCFNGTQHFPGNSLIKYLETIGVKFGADLNAYTSIDETVYNINNVPANVEGAVDSCLWILHDWADGLLLTDEDIDSERGVIHEEWRTRQVAMMRMYEHILPDLYPDGNRYGLRMPIGTLEVIDNFKYQTLRDYYEKWYRPDQQGVIVVGDIDVDRVEGKIKDIFNTIATPVNPAERFYVQIPDNAEPIVTIAKDKEQQYAIGYIFKKHDAVPAAAKANLDYLLTIYCDQVMNIMAAQRLNEMMMSADPPFVQAQYDNGDYFLAKTKQALMGIVVAKDGEFETGIKAMYREMLRIFRHGFTASEYDRARAELLTQVESQYKERNKTKSINYCQEYIRHFIDNEPIPGIENEYNILNQMAPNLPVDMVNAYIKELVGEGNLAVACMLPDKEGVTYPSEDELKQMLAAVEAEEIAPYEDESSDEPLVSELPAPGKTVKTAPAKFGYTEYTLSNGAKVYIRSTDFKEDQILMRAFSFGGQSLYPESDALNINLMSQATAMSGLGNFSYTELNKALSGKKVNVSRSVEMFSEDINGSSTPKDFETMLQLTYLNLTSPRRDDEAFQSLATRMRSILENQELNPATAFQDTVVAVAYNNNPRIKPPKAADIDKLDYDRMLTIDAERFGNIGDFKFIFTGNIDVETALPLIEQYIGCIKPSGKKEKYKDIKLRVEKGQKTNIFQKDMEVPKATVAFVESGKDKYNLKNAIVYNIAGQVLRIVFTEEIREKEGGTYGVSVRSNLESIPKPEYTLEIAYDTDPDKYEHLNGRISEILDDFTVSGPSQANLDKAKEYLQKKYTENQRENSYFSSCLRTYFETGVDLATDYEKTLNSITTEDVRAAIAKIRKQGNRIKVVMSGK